MKLDIEKSSEEKKEILEILRPLMFESRKWSDIKDFMIQNLHTEDANYIINGIEGYNKKKSKYAPRNDRYYFLRFSVKNQRIALSRDYEKSPLSEIDYKRKVASELKAVERNIRNNEKARKVRAEYKAKVKEI